MTSSNTSTIKAVSDSDGTPPEPPARPRGMARIQKDQLFYLGGLAHAALTEAERLTDSVYNTGLDRYGSDPKPLVDEDLVFDQIGEALECIEVASEQLAALSCAIRSRQDDERTGDLQAPWPAGPAL